MSGSWCLAGGSTEETVTLTEIWNGTTWIHQATPSVGALADVSCTATTWCMALGTERAATWNGSSWESVAMPAVGGAQSTSFLSDSCTSPSFCLAAGQANFSDGEFEPITAKWNGSQWSLLTTPSPPGSIETDLASVSCPAENACTAVGGFDNDEGVATGEAYAERWNGSTWTIQTTPNPSGGVFSGLNDVSCPTVSSCVAVGYWDRGIGSLVVPLAEEWNGSSWASTGAVLPGDSQSGETGYVSCASADACEAVGDANSASDPNLAEGWNGSAWSVQSTPNPSGTMETGFGGVSCSSSIACVAVGESFEGTSDEIERTIPFAESYSGS